MSLIESLIDDINRAKELLINELDLLADGCKHEDVVEHYKKPGHFTHGGYMWRCTHCFKEHHGWYLYPKTRTVVSWDEFIDGRIAYAPLRMMGD